MSDSSIFAKKFKFGNRRESSSPCNRQLIFYSDLKLIYLLNNYKKKKLNNYCNSYTVGLKNKTFSQGVISQNIFFLPIYISFFSYVMQ